MLALELLDRLLRVVQSFAVVRLRGEPQAHEVLLRDRKRIVEGQIGHFRQPVVLELSIADQARLLGMVLRHRLQQVFPVRADRRSAMLANVGEVFCAVVEIGNRQNLALVADPLDTAHAMAGAAVVVPLRREGAAEAVHDFLHAGQRQIVGVEFHRQDDDVHVVEEIQVDVLDAQIDDRAVHAGDANERDIAAPIDADRRFAVAAQGAARATLAVEESLHVGQKGDELAVVPFLELGRVAGEFVQHLAPGVVGPICSSASKWRCTWSPARSGINCSGQTRIWRKCRATSRLG